MTPEVYAENVEKIWNVWLQLSGLCELLDVHEASSTEDDTVGKERLHALLLPIADNIETIYVALQDATPPKRISKKKNLRKDMTEWVEKLTSGPKNEGGAE